VYVERDGENKADDAEFGANILLTDLFGKEVPLLRYRLTDSAQTGESDCRCGRNLGVLRPTGGRQSSVILLPNGREVFSSILAYSAPPEVRRFRATQVSVDELNIEVEPSPGLDHTAVLAACRSSWTEAIPDLGTIQVRIVDSIEPEVSGKLRYFIPIGTRTSTDATGQ
jgi:phenylacetate-coenzyme A ligase PaaK-like adenylate-forming protein